MNFVKHERITVDPRIMVGKPVIKGTRMPVEQIIRELAGGMTFEEIIDAHPRLTPDDIYAALAYAADTIGNEDIELSIPDDAISG
ncbi:MAG: DUF433 domain-containing protein [Chloroflexi bacterium]|jgi:uncharacterized protein (DUF433 family)|nr:DUF433 domain-containing protein [Chloroflexota bacterium]